MNAPFDTLQLADRLATGGFTEEQAKTAASALSDVFKSSIATLADVNSLRAEMQSFATKGDVAEIRHEITLLRQEFKSDIQALRQEFKSDLEALRQEFKGETDFLKQELGGIRKDMAIAISEARAEIVRWVFGAVGFQSLLIIGAVVALLKFFK